MSSSSWRYLCVDKKRGYDEESRKRIDRQKEGKEKDGAFG